MSGWGSRVSSLVAACAGVVLLGAPATGAQDGTDHRTLFRFADPEITESSGLVDAGSVVYTTNDSGSGPVLYAVDPDTGETAGVTTYSKDEVTDVEALAPGPRGDVWVGDIGDNARSRSEITLYRVRPGRDLVARRVDLTYPDGPRDAETLLVHPRSGRVFVVSKTVFGGTVYEAPTRAPGGSSRLRPFAEVGGLVTDGAFFPDGRHVVLRGYATASVYSFPSFERLGTFTLPAQKQGEGIAVGADGRILLSSEGLRAPVLEVDLPAGLAAEVAGRTGGRPPRADDPPQADEPSPGGEPVETGGPDPVWVAAGVAVLAALAALVRRTRRR